MEGLVKISCVTILSFLRWKGLSKGADSAVPEAGRVVAAQVSLGVAAVGCFAAPAWDFLRLGDGCWISSIGSIILLGFVGGPELWRQPWCAWGTLERRCALAWTHLCQLLKELTADSCIALMSWAGSMEKKMDCSKVFGVWIDDERERKMHFLLFLPVKASPALLLSVLLVGMMCGH